MTDKLAVGGYNAPNSESTQASDFLDQNFGTTSNLVIQVLPNEGTIDSPEATRVADQVTSVIEAAPEAKVNRSFTDKSATDLRSRDSRSGLILVHVSGTPDEAADAAKDIIAELPDDPDVAVRAGGTLGVQQEIRSKVKHDLKISEAIALPVSLAVLVVVFGGLVAAFLPIAVGITSIVTTLLVLLLMTRVTEVSTHALTVAIAFGLGLSIDFGLLMISRFREERDSGKDHNAAIIATVATAGRTIIFSSATVTLAMLSLLVFPTYFLRSVGIAASATVILSALSAIIVLPAMLALLGKRIESLPIIRRKTPPSADSAFWRRFAEEVIRRPLLFALPVVIVLLGLGIPFLKVQFTNPDERALPTDSNARLVAESLQRDYPLDPSQAITLVTRKDEGVLKTLAAEVSQMDNVVLVNGSIGKYKDGALAGPAPPSEHDGAAYAFVYLKVDADTDAAENLVRDIRAKITDKQVEVGGPTATLIDSRDAIADRLPWAIGLIALFTFILLFLFTGSIVVPIKALLLNLLVLSGVLGVMTWIFQEGHLSSLLGFTPAPLNLSMVVLLCAIAFSLSVDYEIFLLSRIKEARDAGMSNTDAIVVGLGRVGRIVTSAALLLTITLVSFANGMSFMKMFGLGTALAVVIDATIIRAIVVPAFLRMAGDFNWWAPKPLKWLHARIGISEALELAVEEATVDVPLPTMAPAPRTSTRPGREAGRSCPPGRGRLRPAPRRQREWHCHRRREPRFGMAAVHGQPADDAPRRDRPANRPRDVGLRILTAHQERHLEPPSRRGRHRDADGQRPGNLCVRRCDRGAGRRQRSHPDRGPEPLRPPLRIGPGSRRCRHRRRTGQASRGRPAKPRRRVHASRGHRSGARRRRVVHGCRIRTAARAGGAVARNARARSD